MRDGDFEAHEACVDRLGNEFSEKEIGAWDCDLFANVEVDDYDLDIDEEDDTGDWQVIALDRFYDRNFRLEY